MDGDQILALTAQSWHQAGRLRGGAVAATVMSNLGLERFLVANGIELRRTAVGDRYVMERMRADGLNLGGEQSGHIILADYSTTGDGLVAALQILAVLAERRQPASQVCRLFEPLPQRLRSVRFTGGSPLADSRVKQEVAEASAPSLPLAACCCAKAAPNPWSA